MQNQLWIAPLWNFLHLSSLQYGSLLPTEQESYKNGIIGLKHIVPCAKCKEHLHNFIHSCKAIPFHDITSSYDMFKFSYELHADVQASLKRTDDIGSIYSLSEAYEIWKTKAPLSDTDVINMIKYTSFFIPIESNIQSAMITYSNFCDAFKMFNQSRTFKMLCRENCNDVIEGKDHLLNLLRSHGII